MGTIKVKLFVSDMRNLSPERVIDLFGVPQPFSVERHGLTTRVPDSWSRLSKSHLCSSNGPSLMQMGQISGGSDRNPVMLVGKKIWKAWGPRQTLWQGGQDAKMGFFLKPHGLE